MRLFILIYYYSIKLAFVGSVHFYICNETSKYFSPIEYSVDFLGELIGKLPENQEIIIEVFRTENEKDPFCELIFESIPSFSVNFKVICRNKDIKGSIFRFSIAQFLNDLDKVINEETLKYIEIY